MIREPFFSGLFYPEDPLSLKREVNFYLSQVNYSKEKLTDKNILKKQIKALIVPHAGYQYSALVAAYGFKLLENKNIEKVILLGPSHYFSFSRFCLSPFSHFKTPLGNIPSLKISDLESLIKPLKIDLEKIFFESFEIHQQEHCLEVELPFLQMILKNEFKIIPILISEIDEALIKEFNKFLEKIFDVKTILIVSSDLSHYYPYQKAVFKDNQTIALILDKDEEKLLKEGEACGLNAIYTLLKFSKLMNLTPSLIKYLNSGDTSGNPSKVVGYASIAFY
ncbi:MAG: AmmeMemoRadiSam system protein B [Candidatus Paceibacterota bacterium]